MAVKIVRNETVVNGITCGKRSNGARCVLWSDDTFEWFTAEDFSTTFGV